ncbi:hypothetical protein GGR55DRAFT_191473 [Xylaria sp. FL0064]|nr:hypothetical protein GGR55DRAFT_191473 [Xylaria sp. FL0064]
MAWLISVTARRRLACLTVLAATLQPGFFVPVFPSESHAHHFSIHPPLPIPFTFPRAAALSFNSPSHRPPPDPVAAISNQKITSCVVGPISLDKGFPLGIAFLDWLFVWRHACLRLRLLICADSSSRPFVSSPGALFAAAHSSPCIVSFSCTLVTIISDAVVYLADRSDTLCPGQDGRP